MATGIYKHKRGYKLSEETKGKMLGRVPWNKGTKGVMKAWNKGKVGIKQSDATKKKKSESLKRAWAENRHRKGRRIQIKHCLDCGISLSYASSCLNGKYCTKHAYIGGRNPFFGKKHSEETKRINAEAHSGENAANWKGGIDAGKAYRVRKFNAEGFHTLEEWETLKRKYNYMCLCCKAQEPFIVLSEDHIIPLSVGGSDYITNIQPLCHSCNSRKYNKIIDYTSLCLKI